MKIHWKLLTLWYKFSMIPSDIAQMTVYFKRIQAFVVSSFSVYQCYWTDVGVSLWCLYHVPLSSFFCSMSLYPSPYLNIFVNMVSSYGQFVVHDFPSDIHVCYCYSHHIYNIYWRGIHLFFCLCNIASDLKTTLHVDDPLLSYPGSRTFQSLSI